jgi:hypothetical protein
VRGYRNYAAQVPVGKRKNRQGPAAFAESVVRCSLICCRLPSFGQLSIRIPQVSKYGGASFFLNSFSTYGEALSTAPSKRLFHCVVTCITKEIPADHGALEALQKGKRVRQRFLNAMGAIWIH